MEHFLKREKEYLVVSRREKNVKCQFILDFLIQIANTDGYIDPGEVKILQKTAEIYGLDPNKIFKDIHEQ